MIPVIRTYHRLPNIIDEFIRNDCFGGRAEDYNCACKPAVNVIEHDSSFQIDVAAPGFERNELKVTINDNVLTITSVSSDKEPKKKDKYLKREFTVSAFSRSFELPDNAEPDKIEASQKDGILSISIPKKAKVEIPVQEIEVK